MNRFAYLAAIILSVCYSSETQAFQGQCTMDANSGLQIPVESSGLCVSELAMETVVAHRNDHGVVFFAFIDDTYTRSFKNLYTSVNFSANTTQGRVVFCPISLLSESTGLPNRDCISESSYLIPGPKALSGNGQASGIIGFASDRVLSCNSSFSVVARIEHGEAMPAELNSSILLSDGQNGDCAINYSGMTLRPLKVASLADGLADRLYESSSFADIPPENQESYQRAVDALNQFADMTEDQWHQADELMGMDDKQFRLAMWMTHASAEQLRELAGIIDSDGIALMANDGTIYKQSEIGPGAATITIRAGDVEGVLDSILSLVRGIRTVTNRVLSRMPDRPDVRKLLDDTPIGEISDMLGVIREQMSGMIALIKELREEAANFDPDTLRVDLQRMLDNVEEIWMRSQGLICLEAPNFQPRELNNELLEKLVDKAPNLLLRVLNRVLTNIEDWQLDNLVSAFPMDALEFCENETEGLANQTKSVSLDSIETNVKIKACDLRRKFPMVDIRWQLTRILSRLEFAENLVPNEIAATAGGVAVGGAAAGSKVQNPVDLKLRLVILLMKRTDAWITRYQAKRAECLANDNRYERDILSCTVMASYVSNKGDVLTEMRDLVDRRTNEVDDSGSDIGDARAKLDLFDAKFGGGNFRGSYLCLCDAYLALTQRIGGKIPFGRCN